MKTETQTQFRLVRTPGFRAGKPAVQHTLLLDKSIIATKQRVRREPVRYIVVSTQDGRRFVKWKTRISVGVACGDGPGPLPNHLTDAELRAYVEEVMVGKHREYITVLKIEEDGTLSLVIENK